jgi:flagellar biosynthesis protein FliR
VLHTLLGLNLFAFFTVFARLGTAVMLLPGFGETQVNPRIRLGIALGASLVVLPVVSATLPPMPASPIALATVLMGEVFIGLFLGTVVRLMVSALQIAGSVVASQTGLANALVPEIAAQGQQGAITTNFLVLLALVLMFSADLHHEMLKGMVSSYRVFPPGDLPAVGDFSDALSRVVQRTFVIGLQMAAPLLIVGFLLSLGMGLIARLMPQLQIFFIAAPLQLALGFLVFAAALGAMMGWYLESFAELLDTFLPAG